jgi:dTDP-4-amino-4,6-dideoxygalactose transaminase
MPLYHGERQPALTVTEHLATRIMTMPISSSMTVEDADYVIESVADLLSFSAAAG